MKVRSLAVLLLFALLYGCAQQGPYKKAPGLEAHLGGPAVISLDDFDNTERCARVSPGQELQYSFDADGKTIFTIYTVEEDGTREAVSTDARYFIRGTLTPEKETVYCLEWRIRTRVKVRIDYRVDILDK